MTGYGGQMGKPRPREERELPRGTQHGGSACGIRGEVCECVLLCHSSEGVWGSWVAGKFIRTLWPGPPVPSSGGWLPILRLAQFCLRAIAFTPGMVSPHNEVPKQRHKVGKRRHFPLTALSLCYGTDFSLSLIGSVVSHDHP